MNINVYDFDGTIYDGDSTLDFYIFCLKNNKIITKSLPFQLKGLILFILRKISKDTFKEYFYSFLNYIDDIDDQVEKFWKAHRHKIKPWYLDKKSDRDIIVSASSEFLLSPICKELNCTLIGSIVDKKNGHCIGVNCHGKEKVNRLCDRMNDFIIDEFYSDSLSDEPLASLSKKSYRVIKDHIVEWNDYKEKSISLYKNAMFSIDFIRFLLIGVINAFTGILFSYLFSSTFSVNLAFAYGYSCSLILSYILNSFFTFKYSLSLKRFLMFCLSYIPNFLIQNLIIFLFYNLAGMHRLLVYTLAVAIAFPITFLLSRFKVFTES